MPSLLPQSCIISAIESDPAEKKPEKKYKIRRGGDIARIRKEKDGALYAVNPENAFIGMTPETACFPILFPSGAVSASVSPWLLRYKNFRRTFDSMEPIRHSSERDGGE